MADIFISYARENRKVASKLAALLIAQDWTVWWDHDIRIGEAFPTAIQRELEIARCVVVLWSGASIKSDWVQNEAAEAAARGLLLPIRIQDVRVPLQFRHLQTVELVNWRSNATEPEFVRLLQALNALLYVPALDAHNVVRAQDPLESNGVDADSSDQVLSAERYLLLEAFAVILLLLNMAVGLLMGMRIGKVDRELIGMTFSPVLIVLAAVGFARMFDGARSRRSKAIIALWVLAMFLLGNIGNIT